VVGAVVEALRDGGLEGNVSVKRLLGQVDRENAPAARRASPRTPPRRPSS